MSLSAIENVVVLMFENRSFDHIFGDFPGVDGLLGEDGFPNPEYYNLPDPTHPPSQDNAPVHPKQIEPEYPLPKYGFNHHFGDGMIPDLFGPGTTGYVNGPINAPVKTWPATNSGFYSSETGAGSGEINGPDVMSYYRNGSLKALHALAREFVVCDKWFCDFPGLTLGNRCFTHCATAGNLGIDDAGQGTDESKTIFELLEENGKTWKFYHQDKTQIDSWFLNGNIDGNKNTLPVIKDLAADIANGTLPFYSFIMCWSHDVADTSMHPASQIQPGENLLAAVYNALRVSEKTWKKTLFIVTFDENGGMYDHVVPPATVQPAPGPVATEWYNNTTYQFDFRLLGPRVPAILISPWLKRGVDNTEYRNTSILRLLEDIMRPQNPIQVWLTERDRTANSIARAFDQFGAAELRADCPPRIDTYPNYPFSSGNLTDEQPADEKLAVLPPAPHMPEVANMYLNAMRGHEDSGRPITREFATNADLNRYMQQRERTGRWYREGAQNNASIEISENTPGQWIWKLKDAGGTVVAAPGAAYASREMALEALDKVRFLLHELQPSASTAIAAAVSAT